MSGQSFQYLDTTSELSSEDIEDETYVRHDEFKGTSTARAMSRLMQSPKTALVPASTIQVTSAGKVSLHPAHEFQYMLDSVMQNFRMASVEKARLVDIVKSAIKQIHKLKNNEGQPLRWIYLPALPASRPSGRCLTLEVGCSVHCLQVSLFEFRSDTGTSSFKLADHRICLLTSAIRRAHMHQFCDFVATCVKRVLDDNSVHSSIGNTIDMGVAAGFDLKVKAQRSPASASVMSSSKDYTMAGFIGRDLVTQLRAAFNRASIHVQITMVVNDAVGVLLAGLHEVQSLEAAGGGSDCSIGVICNRHDCNVAFLETDRDFLDLCGGDERLLVLCPRGSGYCAVLNSAIGSMVGRNGELDGHASLLEMKLLKRLKSKGLLAPADSAGILLDQLASGAWYPYLLHETINALAERKLIGVLLRTKLGSRQSDCFEIFTHCDRWRSGGAESAGCGGGGGAVQLAAALQPLLGVRQLNADDAVLIANVCHAIVNRTAEILGAAVVAVAHRTYGKAFPKKMVIACGGSLFKSLSELSQLLEKSLKSLAPADTEVLLRKVEASFGCAVTTVSIGQKPWVQRLN